MEITDKKTARAYSQIASKVEKKGGANTFTATQITVVFREQS